VHKSYNGLNHFTILTNPLNQMPDVGFFDFLADTEDAIWFKKSKTHQMVALVIVVPPARQLRYPISTINKPLKWL
jgi:hypothetical protein